MRGVLTAALVLTLVVALALSAFEFLGYEEGAVGLNTSRTGSPTEATAELEELEVASPGSMSGYSRRRQLNQSNPARTDLYTVSLDNADLSGANLQDAVVIPFS